MMIANKSTQAPKNPIVMKISIGDKESGSSGLGGPEFVGSGEFCTPSTFNAAIFTPKSLSKSDMLVGRPGQARKINHRATSSKVIVTGF